VLDQSRLRHRQVPSAPHQLGADLRGTQRERRVKERRRGHRVREAAPAHIVRRARLLHRSSKTGEALDYLILQTTELEGGRVVRQVNLLDSAAG